jgi:hypothetical protein
VLTIDFVVGRGQEKHEPDTLSIVPLPVICMVRGLTVRLSNGGRRVCLGDASEALTKKGVSLVTSPDTTR